MKIEKVNENQIRCTLTKEDLASRELKISELAYGTEKAKSLFRDMMQQANYEFGFEAEDIPLMIEAIPMNAECIVLIITKVEDPDELDTRFSRFAPSIHEDDDGEITGEDIAQEEVADLFKKLNSGEISIESAAEAPKLLIRLFQFDSLHNVLKLAGQVGSSYECISTLYKASQDNQYFLLVSNNSEKQEGFHKLCNIASEYGIPKRVLPATPSYLEEHYDVIVSSNALQTLSGIGRS